MMRLPIALFLLLVACFFACDQGQQAGTPDITGPGRQFVEMLASGNYAGVFATFDATMKSAMPEDKIAEAWQSLQLQVGPFQKIVQVSQTKEQGYDVAYVNCEFEKGKVNVKVVYDAKKEVSGLWFVP